MTGALLTRLGGLCFVFSFLLFAISGKNCFGCVKSDALMPSDLVFRGGSETLWNRQRESF